LAGIASAPPRPAPGIPRQRILSWSKVYWLFWLRVKLLLRDYTRDWRRILGAIAVLLIALPIFGGIALGTFAAYIGLPQSQATEVLLIVLVGLYIFWSVLPLIEFSVNEGLDVTKLTLYPLTRVERMTSLLLATLLDIPTLGILALFLAILLGWSFPLPTLLIAGPALVVAYIHIVGLSQLVLATFMGLLRSRRYRDMTIILFALFGSLCSLSQQLIVRHIGRFDRNFFASIHLAQYLRFTPAGMAGWAITRANIGDWAGAIGWLAASAALTIPLLWLWMVVLEHGLATAETAGGNTRRVRRRNQRDVSPASAATTSVLYPSTNSHANASESAAQHQADVIYPPTSAVSRNSPDSIPLDIRIARAANSARRRMVPTPVQAIFVKDLRYFWRDPQLKASMLSSLFILIVIFVGPVLGTNSGFYSVHPWSVLFSCIAPLFLTMNLSLNIFGLERQALTTLFLFPVRPQYILWGKNLAVASVAFTEQVLLAAAFAILTHGWSYFIPAIVMGAAAIAVMLGCGNMLSVFLPFRVAQFKMGRSSSGSPESGCLRTVIGMLSLLTTLVILSPVIAGVVIPIVLKTPFLLAVTLPIALLYGLGIHQGASRFIASRLLKRMPEILALTTRE
jgi:ABC-2 type transport system permease protein